MYKCVLLIIVSCSLYGADKHRLKPDYMSSAPQDITTLLFQLIDNKTAYSFGLLSKVCNKDIEAYRSKVVTSFEDSYPIEENKAVALEDSITVIANSVLIDKSGNFGSGITPDGRELVEFHLPSNKRIKKAFYPHYIAAYKLMGTVSTKDRKYNLSTFKGGYDKEMAKLIYRAINFAGACELPGHTAVVRADMSVSYIDPIITEVAVKRTEMGIMGTLLDRTNNKQKGSIIIEKESDQCYKVTTVNNTETGCCSIL